MPGANAEAADREVDFVISGNKRFLPGDGGGCA
jgi:hypothetical protein